jgi:hypothetical protein
LKGILSTRPSLLSLLWVIGALIGLVVLTVLFHKSYTSETAPSPIPTAIGTPQPVLASTAIPGKTPTINSAATMEEPLMPFGVNMGSGSPQALQLAREDECQLGKG